MKTKLKILHLEDNESDAELVKTRLKKEELECEVDVVDNETDFVDKLADESFDLVLADRLTPTFDGMSALKLVREKRPELPFIFVSGTLDEEVAIESLKTGATDYVLKHRLSRLVPAVRRALEELKNRKEKHILEQQLLQAQKMESLGTLVGGIAHDFNNILAIIRGYGDLLESETQPELTRTEAITTIMQAADRGSSLVKQLMTFARKTEALAEEVDVNKVISELLKMLRRTFPKTIRIETKLDPEIPRIMADSNHLHQALLNLCLNARDAMPNGGKLTIITGPVEDKGFHQSHPNAKTGLYICIKISDTGTGMDEETKKKIFDPFFTTKEKDKGTGLGLAVVYGVVQSQEGFIDVESKLGQGTTFTLYFPAAGQMAMKAKEIGTVLEERLEGNETILLVEDEQMLNNLVKNFLEAKGYRVMTAGDGREAIQTYAAHKDKIDLVVSDLGLPQVDGLRMFLELKKLNPDVRVILCSGFLQVHMKSQMLAAGVKDFVVKPYAAGEVLRKIRHTLEEVGGMRNEGVAN